MRIARSAVEVFRDAAMNHTDLPIHLEGDWRRKTPRIEVLGQLHGTLVAMDVPILVRNIGAGGFGIESPVPFPPGATHVFRFTAGTGLRVVLKACTRHCQEGTPAPDGTTRYNAG